jgi:hypothetical protein
MHAAAGSRCPLYGVLRGTNYHMLCACECRAQQTMQLQFLTEVGAPMPAQAAAEPTERNALSFWILDPRGSYVVFAGAVVASFSTSFGSLRPEVPAENPDEWGWHGVSIGLAPAG